MWQVVFRSVRARWWLFLGTFVALTFGIAVMAGMFNIMISANDGRPLQNAPARYDGATIIIEANQKLEVTQSDGTKQSLKLKERKLLPADTAKALSEVPGIASIVTDYSFGAAIIGNPGASDPASRQIGHGWSSAQLTPFTLTSGSAPQTNQVVITEAIAQRGHIGVGDTVSIVTPTSAKQFSVSGIARTADAQSLPGEDSLFFSDEQVPVLSATPGQADAIGIIADASADTTTLKQRVAEALPDKNLNVLSGADKGGNVAAELYNRAIQPAIELTGFNISLAGFICIFVVAATASFSIAQRRQEIALLRLVGATSKQVRRMVMGETAVIALAAAVAGSLFGVVLAILFASILKHYGMAPAAFTASGTLLGSFAASAIGIVVALTGVFFASRRAGKVRAAEAMRDAVAEQRVMTPGRWITGMFFLATAIGLIFFMITLGGVAAIAIAVLVTEILAVALALLMPAFIKPIISLMTAPLLKALPAIGGLVRANLRNDARRTASTAAPIVVAVSITVSLVGASMLASNANRVAIQQRTVASYIVLGSPTGIPAETIAEMRRIPGVAAIDASTETSFYMAGDISTQDKMGIMNVDTPTAFDIDVKEGSLQDVHGNAVAVTILKAQELGWKVGKNVSIYLADGTKTDIHVAAIVNMPAAIPEILASPEFIEKYTAAHSPAQLFVATANGADGDVFEQLRRVASDGGASVQDKDTWLATNAVSEDRDSKVGMTMLLGLALVYLAIAIANTLLMSVSSRAKDLELLRNIGATDGQILRMIAWEAVVTVVTASLIAVAAAGLAIFGVYKAFKEIVPDVELPLLQPAYFAVIAASLVVALLASTVPILLKLRHRDRADRTLE